VFGAIPTALTLIQRYSVRLAAEGIVWSPVMEAWDNASPLETESRDWLRAWWKTQAALQSPPTELGQWESVLVFQSAALKAIVAEYIPPEWLCSARWEAWLGAESESDEWMPALRRHPLTTESEQIRAMELLRPRNQRAGPLRLTTWGPTTTADDKAETHSARRHRLQSIEYRAKEAQALAQRGALSQTDCSALEAHLSELFERGRTRSAETIDNLMPGIMVLVSHQTLREATVLLCAKTLIDWGRDSELATCVRHPALTVSGRLAVLQDERLASKQRDRIIGEMLEDGVMTLDETLWLAEHTPSAAGVRRELLGGLACHTMCETRHIEKLLRYVETVPDLGSAIFSQIRWRRTDIVREAMDAIASTSPSYRSVLLLKFTDNPSAMADRVADEYPRILYSALRRNPEKIRPILTQRMMGILLTTGMPEDRASRTDRQLWLHEQWRQVLAERAMEGKAAVRHR